MPDCPRILHIYKDFWPPVMGGAEKTINLMCHAVKGVFDPRVLVSNRCSRTEETIEDGFRVAKVATFGRYLSAPLTPGLSEWISRIPADILHVHLPNPTAELAVLHAKPRAPVVVTWHSDVVRQAWAMAVFRPAHHRFLNHVARIMPTSPPYLETSRELEPFRQKCTVVPLAIRVGQYNLSESEESEVKCLKDVKRRPVISFVGRLRYYKGLHILLEAMRDLQADLWIIGTGGESDRLNRMAQEFQLTDRVHFLGDLSDEEVKIRLHASDIYCLPSHLRAEAFGLNQIEAMACGLPVVSTDVGGVAFVNRHGESGLVVPAGDVAALREALRQLLDDRDLRMKLGEGAMLRARGQFDLMNLRESLINVYSAVLNEGASAHFSRD